MKLLVTGGTGFLGSYILKELEKPGYKEKFKLETIRLFVRNPEKGKKIKSDKYKIEIVVGDMTDEAAIKEAVKGIDAVIHVASKYAIKGKKKDFMKINVDGTRYLLEGLEPGSIFVLTSSTAVYGWSTNKGQPFAEDYEPKNPFWHYQVSKKMQEDLARKMCQEKGIYFVALRPPMISGPGDDPTRVLMDNLKKKMIPLCRGGKGIVPVTHPEDAANAHLLALEKAKENDGEAFHFVSFHVPFKDFANEFNKGLGLKPLKMKVPYWMIYSFAAFLEFLPLNLDYTRFSVKMLGASDQLITTKITEKLGFKPKYKLEESVKESVEWYKALKEEDCK